MFGITSALNRLDNFNVDGARARDQQRGNFLVAAVLGLAIAAVVTGALVNQFFGAKVSAQASAEADNIKLAYGKIQEQKTNGSFANITVQTLCVAGAFGNRMGACTGTVLNAFNGAITFTGTATGYTLTWSAVPDSACPGLISTIANMDIFTTPLPTCNDTGTTDLAFTGV